MRFLFSRHWLQKREERQDITLDSMEFAVVHSPMFKDRHWKNALNAMCRVPPSGRLLKVVYKREGQSIKVITAYWLE